jgi:photosystem II stability/assembly factor-like uncharacterized protein
LALGTNAQWVAVNQANIELAPNTLVVDLHAASPTTMWGVVEENTAVGRPTNFVRTANPAGTEFVSLGVTGGNSTLDVGNIHGFDNQTALASLYPPMGTGGEILRTTNGGTTWSVVSPRSAFTGGFLNFVTMFNANEGVAFGDPNGGNFEVLRTTNGGLSWARIPNANLGITPLSPDEYGLVRSFFVLGNTIWAGNSHASGTTPLQGRIFKSTNQGQTWTAVNVPLPGGVANIAFTDPLNGIANSGTDLIKTTDGGTTWTTVTPNSSATGRFYWFDIDAVPGTRNFISVGGSLAAMNAETDFGSSWSSDGVTWRNIDRGVTGQPLSSYLYFTVDAVSNVNAYVGGLSNPMTGAGGIFRWGGATLTPTRTLAARNSELQKALAVYPNPSASGLFKVKVVAGMKAGATLTVVDALGRQVAAQTLTATNVAAESVNLDLSKEKAGVYTLQVRTESGVAHQNLVIQ